ncbi:LysR family transcriptional regulator [Pseudodonghicola xiamenensis]|uniref:LysR family transcriptional regulator n=1 Tax=Pseudodonghicola xiamenensis TaxID=337702 RepID=A0A8J3MCN5_9RHOB|nr:LysR substrate-binding domain-containing protein [Pseudodonghicola xiamenensis]GHG92788.1 LysR family transcriptional regulator [Pseudodonghicola xiamenensis]
MINAPLDLDAVRAFVRIAELGSFTRAARATQVSQSAISLKLKRLEERLGCRLVDRTPRHVDLTQQGTEFLQHARILLEAHDRALAMVIEPRQRLTIGISDHVAGPELPAVIARINAEAPQLVIEIQIGSSDALLQQFDRRELDVAIVRFDADRDDGTILCRERIGWFAAPGWSHREGLPLPLATMPDPCGMRKLACETLDAAGLAWREVFVGGGVAAVSAAVMARLGIAALSPRMLPPEAVDVGAGLGLPALPHLPIALHSRATTADSRSAIDALSSAFRSAVRG